MPPVLNEKRSAFAKFRKNKNKLKQEKIFSISAKILAFFSIIGTFLALMGTALALIGEGVAMAVESIVEIPHHLLIGSSFDYIELSLWAAVQMMSNLTNRPPEYVYVTIFFMILPVTIGLFIFFSVIILTRHKVVTLQKVIIFAKIQEFFQPPTSADSNRMLIAKGGLYGILFNSVFPAILVFGLFITFVVIGLLTLPTAIGYKFGKAHIETYVVQPSECAPMRDRSALLKPAGGSKPNYAQCVAVANDRRDFGRGRVVLTTSTAIVLYDPNTGHGWRVPVKDASIETVESLTVPSKGTINSTLKGHTLLEIERGSPSSSSALEPAPEKRFINE